MKPKLVLKFNTLSFINQVPTQQKREKESKFASQQTWEKVTCCHNRHENDYFPLGNWFKRRVLKRKWETTISTNKSSWKVKTLSFKIQKMTLGIIRNCPQVETLRCFNLSSKTRPMPGSAFIGSWCKYWSTWRTSTLPRILQKW